jgi:hydrogenase maturation protease
MKDTLIIGIGSILRGDDGIGSRVIDELEKHSLPENIALERGDLSGLDLLKYFPKFKNIIIIDAADMKEKPGTIRIFDLKDIKNNAFQDAVSTHGMALPETLALSEKLDIKSQIKIIGIQPKDVSFNLNLTDKIEELIPSVVKLITEIINGTHIASNI